MFRVSLIGEETPQLKRVQDFAKRYPDLAKRSFADNITPFAELMVERLLRRRVPGPVRYPIQWTSEKQRRAFFATDGFGHGIPYKRRRPGIEAEWLVVSYVDSGGATLSVVNRNPASPFVYGQWKQQFHTNTGWPDARPIIDDIAEFVRPEVVTDQILLAQSVLGTR